MIEGMARAWTGVLPSLAMSGTPCNAAITVAIGPTGPSPLIWALQRTKQQYEDTTVIEYSMNEITHCGDRVEKLRHRKIASKIRNIVLTEHSLPNVVCKFALSRNVVLTICLISVGHRVFQHNPDKQDLEFIALR
jgi:hypothetical protein